MQLDVSGRDVFNLMLALLLLLLAAYLHYAGVKGALRDAREYELPNWSGAAVSVSLALVLLTFAAFVPAVRDEDPNELKSFRSIAGAHNWSVRFLITATLPLASGFIFAGVLPPLRIWWKRRQRGEK